MFHILVGLTSIGFGVLALTKNDLTLLKLQLATFIGTIGTGTWLVMTQPISLAHFCISGVVFSAISVVLMVLSHRQLAYTLR